MLVGGLRRGVGGGDGAGAQLGDGASVDVGCWTLLVVDGRCWLLGALVVCPFRLMGEKYICMVV